MKTGDSHSLGREGLSSPWVKWSAILCLWFIAFLLGTAVERRQTAAHADTPDAAANKAAIERLQSQINTLDQLRRGDHEELSERLSDIAGRLDDLSSHAAAKGRKESDGESFSEFLASTAPTPEPARTSATPIPYRPLPSPEQAAAAVSRSATTSAPPASAPSSLGTISGSYRHSSLPVTTGPPVAENGSYYGEISDKTGRPKTVEVRGYYRSDGTYVRGHYRSAPRH